MKKLFLSILLSLIFTSCNSEDDNINSFNNENNGYIPVIPDTFVLKGTVWSPGADRNDTLTENHFPIAGAVVTAWEEMPELPIPGKCRVCEALPEDVPSTVTAHDGSFKLTVAPEKDYYISVSKGDFFKVTYWRSGTKGNSLKIMGDETAAKEPMLSLPSENDPENGKVVPRILIIVGRGELLMHTLFDSMGMNYGVEYFEVDDSQAEFIVANMEELKKYHMIIATCGDEATYLKKDNVKANIKQYIREGGRLYIDDFAYDWAEQIWPEFLTFKVDYTLDYELGICGSGLTPPPVVGQCVSYSCYDAQGFVMDSGLNAWLEKVHPYTGLSLRYGCNVLHGLGAGVQGECTNPESSACVNGNLVAKPKVWLEGSSLYYERLPMTVSWKYYCGRVLYTVYHTHASDDNEPHYKLIPQEKIMLYLLFELQKCNTPEIVD
ncbi:hypothetical protein KKF34_06275 [Myxococcota bacterium]|nr:hypothetical protein [Myxococcota bacterium]MBU1381775.1 hypothetical protein [Myxococcota bacterium]MBU1496465.1 hypothetical protein [Myxococcota bacterium]